MPGIKQNKKGGNANFAQCVTDALKQIALDYISGDAEAKTLKADLESLRPVDRVTVMEKYLKYILPTMGSVSVKGQGEDGEIEIKVTYSSPEPKTQEQEDEDTSNMDYSEQL